MSEIKLLPCPFCGGEAIIYEDEQYNAYMIGCKKCCAIEPMTEWASREEAIKQWNTRKPMQEIVERLEEERNLLKHERNEAIEYDDEQIIFATNNQIRAFDYSIRVVREVGGMNELP